MIQPDGSRERRRHYQNTTRNDGNAVHRVGVWRTRRHQGMPGLVVGNNLLLFLAELDSRSEATRTC
jgi:hypothetical protein